MKQVPHSEPTNIRRRCTKSNRHGKMAPGIYAFLIYKLNQADREDRSKGKYR